jgi:hypothetical protein
MDQIAELSEIVQQKVEHFAQGEWAKARSFAVSDNERQIYTVIAIPDYPRKFPAVVVMAARIENGKVIVEHDISDKPLWEELVRAGIPRDQIILTYAGEQLPQAS